LAASGIGLVLGPLDDGTCLAGIDLDNCRHNDSLTPWAQKIVDRFGTYTEISPSGSGVKLFFLLTQADAASVRSHLGNRDGRKWSAASRATRLPSNST
jgi:primase-polymerase (primpol)-like protein